MRTNRLYLVGILLACGWGGARTTLAQQAPAAYVQPAAAAPLYVLNSSVIINSLLTEIVPADIQEVMVYHGPKDQLPVEFRNIGLGIVQIRSPQRIKGQSFAKLAKQLGVRGPVLFALNGHPLDAPAVAGLRIAPAAIGQLHIVRPTAGQPATLVDVWLAHSPKTESAPGTIMIRGTAGR